MTFDNSQHVSKRFFSIPGTSFGASMVLNDLESAVEESVYLQYRKALPETLRLTEYKILVDSVPEWSFNGVVPQVVLSAKTTVAYEGQLITFHTEEVMSMPAGNIDVADVRDVRKRNASEGAQSSEYRHKVLTAKINDLAGIPLRYHIQREDTFAFGRSQDCSPSVDGWVIRYLSRDSFDATPGSDAFVTGLRQVLTQYPVDGILASRGIAPHPLPVPANRDYSFAQEVRLTCSLKDLVQELVTATKKEAERRSGVHDAIPF